MPLSPVPLRSCVKCRCALAMMVIISCSSSTSITCSRTGRLLIPDGITVPDGSAKTNALPTGAPDWSALMAMFPTECGITPYEAQFQDFKSATGLLPGPPFPRYGQFKLGFRKQTECDVHIKPITGVEIVWGRDAKFCLAHEEAPDDGGGPSLGVTTSRGKCDKCSAAINTAYVYPIPMLSVAHDSIRTVICSRATLTAPTSALQVRH